MSRRSWASDGRFGTIARDHDPASLAEAIGATLDRRAAFDPAELRADVARRYAPEVVAADLLARFAALGAVPGIDGPAVPAGGSPRACPSSCVGFRRASAIGRIPALPADLAAQVAVVTSAPVHPLTGQPAGDPSPPSAFVTGPTSTPAEVFRARLAALGEAAARSPGNVANAPASAAGDPSPTALGRPGRALRRGTAAGRRGGDRAASAALGRAGPVTVLPLDIDDLEWIEPFLADGSRRTRARNARLAG